MKWVKDGFVTKRSTSELFSHSVGLAEELVSLVRHFSAYTFLRNDLNRIAFERDFMRVTLIVFLVLILSSSALPLRAEYFVPSQPLANQAEYEGEPCQEGSPYYSARNIGKWAYSDLHQLDFIELFSGVPPILKDLYGECVEQLGDIDSLIALLNVSVYVNVASLEAIKELVIKKIVEGVCSEIDEFALEVYAEIADALPLGEYAYELNELFEIKVEIGE